MLKYQKVIILNELFLKELKCDEIYFKYAKGKSVMQGKEFHAYHEIILILDGDIELITEKIHASIKPNTIIVIPKETYHQVIINGNENSYLRCTLNFDDSLFLQCPMSEVELYESDYETEYLFNILKNNTSQINDIILKSVLALLTNALQKRMSDNTDCTCPQFSRAVIEYIQENLDKKISINELARKFNISDSALQHRFKDEMKISIHKYIVKKRLIAARRLIISGYPSTLVAVKIGFDDYSGFYKQYKKMFGQSPSNTNKHP